MKTCQRQNTLAYPSEVLETKEKGLITLIVTLGVKVVKTFFCRSENVLKTKHLLIDLEH